MRARRPAPASDSPIRRLDAARVLLDVSDRTETHADAGRAFGAALQAFLAAKAGDPSPTVRLVIQCDQPCTFALTAFDTGASSRSTGSHSRS